MKKKLEKLLIETAIKIAKQGRGCLLVIQNTHVKYKLLFEKDIKQFNVFENKRRLEILSTIDGAIILDKKGNLLDYGAKIVTTKILRNYGTRHSAGISASKNKNFSVISSEEDKRVRIFRDGRLVMEINPFQRNVEKSVPQVASLLEAVGVGGLSTIAAPLIGITGITIIPGIIIFGIPYWIVRKFIRK